MVFQQAIWKNLLVRLDDFPKDRGKHEKIFETTNQIYYLSKTMDAKRHKILWTLNSTKDWVAHRHSFTWMVFIIIISSWDFSKICTHPFQTHPVKVVILTQIFKTTPNRRNKKGYTSTRHEPAFCVRPLCPMSIRKVPQCCKCSNPKTAYTNFRHVHVFV